MGKRSSAVSALVAGIAGANAPYLFSYGTLVQPESQSMDIIEPRDRALEQWRPGVETRMVVSAQGGAAQLCIFEQWVAPGHGAPTHSHPVEEVLTVREGEAEMWLDGERGIVAAGQALVVPAGRLHGFRNSGTATLHIHAVLASPIFEASMEGASAPGRRWTV